MSWGKSLIAIVCLLSASGICRAEEETTLTQELAAKLSAQQSRDAAAAAKLSGLSAIGKGRQNFREGLGKGRPGRTQRILGYMQIAEGIMGLVAAQKASDYASTSEQALASMGNNPALAATTTAGTKLPASAAAGSAPAASRAKKANVKELFNDEVIDALADVEEEYGIPGDEFANRIIAGQDPLVILQEAKLNRPEEEEAKAALVEAKGSLASDKAALAQNTESSIEAPTAKASSGSSALASRPMRQVRSLKDRLRGKVEREPASETPEESQVAVDADIQAALAEREEKKLRELFREPTIFEVVHRKYQEKFQVITNHEGIHGQ